jgi:hypothetical protein
MSARSHFPFAIDALFVGFMSNNSKGGTTMKRLWVLKTVFAIAALVLLYGGPAFGQEPTRRTLHDAATGKLKPAELPVNFNRTGGPLTKRLPFISHGTMVAAHEALSAAEMRAEGADGQDAGSFADIGQGNNTVGCSDRLGSHDNNIRVNQDCTFRRQAEEKIVFNPANPRNLLAGANDSRVGFNQCSIAWSTDGGETWGDMLPPFRQKVNNPAGETATAGDPNSHTILGGPGTFHTYDAGSDPSPAFDSQGRGFFSCVAFDVFSNAFMLYVAQSPLGAQGSFFRNIGTFSRSFVVVEDNNPDVVHDKPFSTADTFSGSPNRDNVYVTWTVFRFGCTPAGFCSSPIFGSMSTDHGQTFSTPEEISGNSPALCSFGDFFDSTRNPNDCDFDQGSDPIVQANGDVVVVFNNGNTAANNPNAQTLAVHCKPSGSSPAGTAHLNCGSPAKVGDDVIANEPQCDFGRGPEECVPGPWIRTNDFPRIAENRANGDVFATWQDYRNGEYDIQLARSADGGLTWTSLGTVNPDSGLDHYFAAIDVVSGRRTDHVGVSYYRSERVPNENATPPGGFAPPQPGVQQGNSDYVLAGGRAPILPFSFDVLSPVFAPPDGVQAGFNGDYSGLTIVGDVAHPIWSDTRNADPFAPLNGVVHDEDVFTANHEVPNGIESERGSLSLGSVGKSKP